MTRREAHGDLDAVLAECWSRLEDGAGRAAAPFHTPVLGTRDGEDCALRTVVLRRVDAQARRILCHTDRRSPKAAQVAAGTRVSWLFYDAAERVQLRASGAASLHVDDALADAQWRASRLLSRRCYLGAAPGSASPARTSGLPADLEHRAPTEEESAGGRASFAVIACSVDALDWLHLGIHGHARARWRHAGGRWQGSWVAP